jgi:hypothetical protein
MQNDEVEQSAGGLTVRYRGPGVDSGRMSIDEFIPAVRGLERMLRRSSIILANGEDLSPEIFISANFKRSSFEFHIILEQATTAAIALMASDGATSAKHVVSGLFSGARSLIELVKAMKGADKEKLTRVSNEHGVQYNFTINGDNNTINVSDTVARLEQDPVVRAALEPVIEPLLTQGVDEVGFLTDSGEPPSEVKKDEAGYFVIRSKARLVDDSFRISERILTVVKPSFLEGRTWKFKDGDEEFGALMDDTAFQRDVIRRAVLFGTGDQLVVTLAVRMHRAKKPEYRVINVNGIIRPDDPPEQLRLA